MSKLKMHFELWCNGLTHILFPTGGGKRTTKEGPTMEKIIRIIGISATGLQSRYDSDSNASRNGTSILSCDR